MEPVLFPEMLQAGIEALEECRERKVGDSETAVHVYLAMDAIRAIKYMRDYNGFVH